MEKKMEFLKWADFQRYVRKINLAEFARRLERNPKWMLDVFNGRKNFSKKAMKAIADGIKEYPVQVNINEVLELQF